MIEKLDGQPCLASGLPADGKKEAPKDKAS